jgi:hypothetical protein
MQTGLILGLPTGVSGKLKFNPDNQFGANLTLEFNRVTFQAGSTLSPITEGTGVGQFEVTAQIQTTLVNGQAQFGDWSLDGAVQSPAVQNYYRGSGHLTFERELNGESHAAPRHMGNLAGFDFTPQVEFEEHEQTMSGARTVDFSYPTTIGGELRIIFEELTGENLALILLSDVEEGAS